MSDEIVQLDPSEDFEEQWKRTTDDGSVRGVSVSRSRWADEWSLWVDVAEFVREEPLESEFRAAIDAALRAVPGVRSVHEEDREVWLIAGGSSGVDLLTAAAVVVDWVVPRWEAEFEDS